MKQEELKVTKERDFHCLNILRFRYLFAAGRYEQMPRICSMIHISYQTPVHAIVIAVSTLVNYKKRMMGKNLIHQISLPLNINF